jgi:hypothetical protein
MELAEGLEEEGRAELTHDRAVPMMACGMTEKDSGLVRVVVAANGCNYVLDMRDIASVGILDPGANDRQDTTHKPDLRVL